MIGTAPDPRPATRADSGAPALLSQAAIDRVRIAGADDIRRAATALAELARVCGMQVAIAHDIASGQPLVDAGGAILARDVFGWCDANAWWQNPRIALESPLVAACRFESEVFWANAQGFHTRQPNAYLDHIDRVRFESRAMIRAAIVVPVHLPFGQIGAAAWAPLDRARTDLATAWAEWSDGFASLSQVFIGSYVQVMGKTQPLPIDLRLSRREIACLHWAAIGKTDVEIGMIMAISRATVRYHVRNASAKLGAGNRSQTVFRATQLGFISLNSQRRQLPPRAA